MAIGSASFYSIYPITARQTIKHDDTHFTPTAQRLDAVADMAGYGVSHPAYYVTVSRIRSVRLTNRCLYRAPPNAGPSGRDPPGDKQRHGP